MVVSPTKWRWPLTPTAVSCTTARELPHALGEASKITCPTIFHFGREDTLLPVAEAEQIGAAFSDRPDVEVHIHDGGDLPYPSPTPTAARWCAFARAGALVTTPGRRGPGPPSTGYRQGR